MPAEGKGAEGGSTAAAGGLCLSLRPTLYLSNSLSVLVLQWRAESDRDPSVGQMVIWSRVLCVMRSAVFLRRGLIGI